MNKISSNKKGQINLLAPAILALVFGAIVLVFGLVITQSLQETIPKRSRGVFNETFSDVNNLTGTPSARANTCNFANFAVSSAKNASGGSLIAVGNYTTVAATGEIFVTAAGASCAGSLGCYNGTDWEVNYTYIDSGEACIASNKTVVGLGSFADFWEIIVLAVVIAIVIGLLLIVFGGASGRER